MKFNKSTLLEELRCLRIFWGHNTLSRNKKPHNVNTFGWYLFSLIKHVSHLTTAAYCSLTSKEQNINLMNIHKKCVHSTDPVSSTGFLLGMLHKYRFRDINLTGLSMFQWDHAKFYSISCTWRQWITHRLGCDIRVHFKLFFVLRRLLTPLLPWWLTTHYSTVDILVSFRSQRK